MNRFTKFLLIDFAVSAIDGNMRVSTTDLRRIAWNKLAGNWSKVAVVMLLFMLISTAISGACGAIGPGLSVVSSLLLLPMSYAFTAAMLRFVRGGEAPQVNDLFEIYKTNFSRAFLVQFLVGLFTFLWTLLLIIPGIIMGYAYSMSVYIANDNPELSEMDAIKKSRELMNGHKLELFLLDITFIGWIFLCILSFGIGFLWIGPYIQAAHAEFYRVLIGDFDQEIIESNLNDEYGDVTVVEEN